MMAGKLLAANAIVGLVSGVAASGAIWLVLTRPFQAAAAVSTGRELALIASIGQQLLAGGEAVLRFL
jgi:hypothetical protein